MSTNEPTEMMEERHHLVEERDPGAHAMLSVMVTLMVAAFFHMFKEKIPIPFTVFMFLFGMACGGIMLAVGKDMEEFVPIFRVSPKTIFIVFLPILIFDGSAALKRSVFRNISVQALLLAGPGLCINTGILTVVLKLWLYTSWSWYGAICLGAALSATDPVAVVSLLRDLDADVVVTTLTDGEAILNDGASIILFSLFFDAAAGEDFRPAGEVVWRVLLLLFGGFIFGYIWSHFILLFLRRTNDPIVETMLTVGGAYVAFYIADEVLLTSGVIALGVIGMQLADSAGKRPRMLSHMSTHVWEALVFIGNAIIFSLVGLLISFQAIPAAHARDWWILFVFYIVLVLARCCMMGLMLPLLNIFAAEEFRVTWQRFFLLVYGALRGGVGLTLALAINREENMPSNFRDAALFLTGGMVVFSIVFNGTTAFKVVSFLGLDETPPYKQFSQKQTNRLVQSTLNESIHQVLSLPGNEEANLLSLTHHTVGHFRSKAPLGRFSDDKIVKPLLLRAFRTELWSLRERDLVSPAVFGLMIDLCNGAVEKGEFLTVDKVLRHAESRFHRSICHFIRTCGGLRKPKRSRFVPGSPNSDVETNGSTAMSPLTPQGTALMMTTEHPPEEIVEVEEDNDEVLHHHTADALVCEALITYISLTESASKALTSYASKRVDMNTFQELVEERRSEGIAAYEKFQSMHPYVTTYVVTRRAIIQCLEKAACKVEDLHHHRGLPRSMYVHTTEKIKHLTYNATKLKFNDIKKPSYFDTFSTCMLFSCLTEDEAKYLFEKSLTGTISKNKRLQMTGVGIVIRGSIAKRDFPKPHVYVAGDHFGLRAILQRVEFETYYTTEDTIVTMIDEDVLGAFCAEHTAFLTHLWSIAAQRLVVETVSKLYPYNTLPAEDLRHMAKQGRIFFNDKEQPLKIGDAVTVLLLQGEDTTHRFNAASTLLLPSPMEIVLLPQSIIYVSMEIHIRCPLSDVHCPIPFLDEAGHLMCRIIAMQNETIARGVDNSTQMIDLLMHYASSYLIGSYRILTDPAADVLEEDMRNSVIEEIKDFSRTIQTWMAEQVLGTYSSRHVRSALLRWHNTSAMRLRWVTALLEHPKTGENVVRVLKKLHSVHDIVTPKQEADIWEKLAFVYRTSLMDPSIMGRKKLVRRKSKLTRRDGRSPTPLRGGAAAAADADGSESDAEPDLSGVDPPAAAVEKNEDESAVVDPNEMPNASISEPIHNGTGSNSNHSRIKKAYNTSGKGDHQPFGYDAGAEDEEPINLADLDVIDVATPTRFGNDNLFPTHADKLSFTEALSPTTTRSEPTTPGFFPSAVVDEYKMDEGATLNLTRNAQYPMSPHLPTPAPCHEIGDNDHKY